MDVSVYPRRMELPSDGVVSLSFFRPDDAPVMREIDGDPEHRLRFEFPEGFRPSLAHSLEVVARWERERIAGTRIALAVRDAATAALIGGCEIRPLSDGVANLSYWTCAQHRGRGIASRAVALALELAARDLAVRRFEVLVDPDNTPSRRVAARNGFREIGVRDGRILYVLDAGVE